MNQHALMRMSVLLFLLTNSPYVCSPLHTVTSSHHNGSPSVTGGVIYVYTVMLRHERIFSLSAKGFGAAIIPY